MNKIENFRDLEVWKKAHQLVLATYRLTKSFPSDERYGLVSQMRRAAVSVPANVAPRDLNVKEKVKKSVSTISVKRRWKNLNIFLFSPKTWSTSVTILK